MRKLWIERDSKGYNIEVRSACVFQVIVSLSIHSCLVIVATFTDTDRSRLSFDVLIMEIVFFRKRSSF
jgi:hypothetical protein